MWLTVLVLAIAISFELVRPTMVPIMLLRPNPFLQLLAFLLGNYLSGFTAGLLVLFVFHKSPLGSDPSNSGKTQIGIGVVLLLIAAAMALPYLRSRHKVGAREPVDRVTQHSERMFSKGRSPWWAGLIGMGTGLPSIDYFAALVVIASSGASHASQVGALIMLLVVGNIVVLIPLITYVFMPERTSQLVGKFQTWIGSRSRGEFALIVAGVGVLQIVIGLGRL